MVRSKQYNYSSLSDNSAFNKAVIKKSKSVSDQIILYNKEQVALFFCVMQIGLDIFLSQSREL